MEANQLNTRLLAGQSGSTYQSGAKAPQGNDNTDAEKIFLIDFAADEPPQDAANTADPLQTGFLWYRPPLAASTTTEQHVTARHVWRIAGHDSQILTTTVPPGETVVTQVGSFLFGSPGIQTAVELTCCTSTQKEQGGGGGGGCKEGWNRICGGESCVKVLLTNQASEEGYVGLTPNFPAKVIPIKVRKRMKQQKRQIDECSCVWV